MHAGLLLLLWFGLVAGLQLLAGKALLSAVLCSLLLAFVFAPRRTRSLLRRIAVLVLAIVILFGWFTPGEALLIDWPQLSPSREGLSLGAVHLGRLLAVVCAVSLLLEKLPSRRLVAGLYSLSRPLACLGLDPGRFAVCLMLVLQLVDERSAAAPRRWQDWLVPGDAQRQWPALHFEPERLGKADGVVAAAVVAGLLLAWMVR